MTPMETPLALPKQERQVCYNGCIWLAESVAIGRTWTWTTAPLCFGPCWTPKQPDRRSLGLWCLQDEACSIIVLDNSCRSICFRHFLPEWSTQREPSFVSYQYQKLCIVKDWESFERVLLHLHHHAKQPSWKLILQCVDPVVSNCKKVQIKLYSRNASFSHNIQPWGICTELKLGEERAI